MKFKRTQLLVFSVLSLMLTSCGGIKIENGNFQNDVIHASQVKLKDSSITLYAGETYQIEYEILPLDAEEKEVVYTVNNSDVCSVSETGLVTAKQYSGSTTVRVSVKDRPGIYAELRVSSRRRVQVSEIQCSVESFNFFYIGQTKDFSYTVFPLNAQDKTVDVYIEDPTIALLDEDKNSITSLKNGTTNLVLKSLEDGSSVETVIPITVDDNYGKEIGVDPSLNPTQYMTYKELIETSNQDVLTSTATKENPANVLVIPVEFSDLTFDDAYGVENGEELIKNNLEAAFNGTIEDTNYWESVSSYFEISSFGNLNLNFDIADVVKVNYTTNQVIDGTTNVGAVVRSAFSTAKSQNSDYDFTKYDYDKDGLMDSVWFIYSAPDYLTDNSFYNEEGTFWAFVTSFQYFWPNLESPDVGTFGWASYDFMHKKADDEIDAHTYIHETGHLMGLNDYYDYTQSRAPLGYYDMQDCNVGDHNVWTKAALGWINPIIVDASKDIPAKIHLNPRENGGAIFITDNYSGSVFDEYIVLELYTPNGLNELDSTYAYETTYGRMPTESGVKLYHVDARLIYAIQNNHQVYYESSLLKNGIPEDTYLTIAASNTYSYDRNNTAELFNQIELISSKISGGTHQKRFYPYSSEDFFETGDTFDLRTYRSSTHLNSGNLNSSESLDIKIYFTNVNEKGADIVIDTLA